MKENIRSFTEQSPQYMQQDTSAGIERGIVVDVRDPYQLNRVRVAVYGKDGDYPKLDVYKLVWAEPANKGRGVAALELFDRVIVSYDAGDKYAPLIIGTWRAIPMGDGTLPQNKRTGNETRMEGWYHHDLYPEVQIPCASANGNVIYIHDIFMDEKNFASSIAIQDVAGKFFKIRSFKPDAKVWSPIIEVPEGKGALYKYDPGDNESMRYGYEHVDHMDAEAGVIEFGHQRLKHHLITAKEDFTLDLKTQMDEDDGEITREERSTGKVFQSRQDAVFQTMMSGMLSLMAPESVFVNDLMTPPERWDDEEEEESEGGDSQLA